MERGRTVFFLLLRLTRKDPNKQTERRPMITVMDGLNNDCNSDGSGNEEEIDRTEDV
jgi:hypothetical protein